MIKALSRVAFFWFKERVLRIKPENIIFANMVFIVIEIIGENNIDIIEVFSNEEDAKTFAQNIDDYKIIPKNVK